MKRGKRGSGKSMCQSGGGVAKRRGTFDIFGREKGAPCEEKKTFEEKGGL